MFGTLRVLTLATVIGSLALAPLATNAQEKKSTAKKGSGVIQIQEGKDGKFRIFLRNSENKYLAGSLGFETKAEAQKAVEELKEVINDAKLVYPPKAQPKVEDPKAKAKDVKDAKEKAPAKKD
jgi:uncharacterized protein YegP (UPF0339 family)